MSFRFPIVLDLRDQRCLVIGGGPLAAQRADALLAAEAHVVVATDSPGEQINELVNTGRVGLLRRLAQPKDLDGATVAIATLEDGADVAALFAHADANGILFSAADDVDHCHFAMPSVISRGDLMVTVSTSGRAPALSKRLRQLLEQSIGDELGRLVDVLAEARSTLLPRSMSFSEWSDAWSRALEPLEELTARLAAGDEEGVLQRILMAVRAGESNEAGNGSPHQPTSDETERMNDDPPAEKAS